MPHWRQKQIPRVVQQALLMPAQALSPGATEAEVAEAEVEAGEEVGAGVGAEVAVGAGAGAGVGADGRRKRRSRKRGRRKHKGKRRTKRWDLGPRFLGFRVRRGSCGLPVITIKSKELLEDLRHCVLNLAPSEDSGGVQDYSLQEAMRHSHPRLSLAPLYSVVDHMDGLAEIQRSRASSDATAQAQTVGCSYDGSLGHKTENCPSLSSLGGGYGSSGNCYASYPTPQSRMVITPFDTSPRAYGPEFQSLVQYLREDRVANLQKLSQLMSRGKVTFNCLWRLFPNGSRAIWFNNGMIYAGFVRSANYVEGRYPCFKIVTASIRTNGEEYYIHCKKHHIDVFPGSVDITSLCAIPFNDRLPVDSLYVGPSNATVEPTTAGVGVTDQKEQGPAATTEISVEDDEVMGDTSSDPMKGATAAVSTPDSARGTGVPLTKIMRYLETRGRTFREIAIGSHHMEYNGEIIHEHWSGQILSHTDGRVMCDTRAFVQRGKSAALKDQNMTLVGPAWRSDVDYFRTWPTLGGFSLQTKEWGELRVDRLRPIVWNEESFSRLVLPADKKQLIKCLVEQTSGQPGNSAEAKLSDDTDIFTDVVAGKNGGCIFLLHGRPGVGKTLTAETVSELLHRPLYSVSVGQLGTQPSELETRLREILELAGVWNAVVLLDEADIFLEARDKSDIIRSACVSVFLRLLEYHNGVLFLTTNRFNGLDPALHSRVSVAIRYPDLDYAGRQAVWRNCLELAGIPHSGSAVMPVTTTSASSSDHKSPAANGVVLDRLASFSLNGRQIRNAVRLAQALARSEGVRTSLSHISKTLIVSSQFHHHELQATAANALSMVASQQERDKEAHEQLEDLVSMLALSQQGAPPTPSNVVADESVV